MFSRSVQVYGICSKNLKKNLKKKKKNTVTDLNLSYIHRNNPQLRHQQFTTWFQNINKTVDEANIKKGASSNSSCLRAGIKSRLEAETVTQTAGISGSAATVEVMCASSCI